MKQTVFCILTCVLSAVSLTTSVYTIYDINRQRKIAAHGKPQTFRDLLEDNAPKTERTSRDIADDFARDCGWAGDDIYPY